MKIDETGNSDFGFIIWLVVVAWTFAAWLTHVVTCLAAGSWGFLVAGALFAPIGIVHGTGLWLGVW